MGDSHLLPRRIEAQGGGGKPAVYGDLPAAQQPDHRRISFGLCFSLGDIVLKKVNWVNDHKDTIIRAFLDENDDCIDVVNEMIEDGTLEADGKISEDEFVKALFVNNVTIFVNGSETGFYIDLDAEPDYFMGHLVCIEVDCKYKIEVGGFNG